ncbi:hypothetical protein [Thermaurantimonas aggregans]|uniref:hypothetical protein n=1 Tax=Schleiferiaceae TaxID=1333713 RepID=UPI000F58DB5E|nr:hypothetical protein [Thermaurantimonas aggregans]
MVRLWTNRRHQRKKQRKNLCLIFGKGGKYTASQLINRANMYDQPEAYINLMKQDLKVLASELEKFIDD